MIPGRVAPAGSMPGEDLAMSRRPAPVRVHLKSEAVWAVLNRRGWSQSEMARAVGVSPTYLSRLLREGRAPSPRLRERLLEFLQPLAFDDLFEMSRSGSAEVKAAPGPPPNPSHGKVNQLPRPVRERPPRSPGPPEISVPRGFPSKLKALKERSGESWFRFAQRLRVDPRQVARWRKGVKPSGPAMLAVFRLASEIPGGVTLLLSDRDHVE